MDSYPRQPDLSNTALVNFRFIANSVKTTKEVKQAIERLGKE